MLLSFLKKKGTDHPAIELPPLEEEEDKEIICAPMRGELTGCIEIQDLTFQKEMLGQSVAIKPADGKVYAPADGKIEMMIETMHAVSMTTLRGAEILIHVGIDTVNLNGKYFKRYVKEGTQVKRGDLLLEFDLKAISSVGYDMISPIIVCNSEEYQQIEKMKGKSISVGEPIMKLIK